MDRGVDLPFGTAFLVVALLYFPGLLVLSLLFSVPVIALLKFSLIIIYISAVLVHLVWCRWKGEDIRIAEMIVLFIFTVVFSISMIWDRGRELLDVIDNLFYLLELNYYRFRVITIAVAIVFGIAGAVWRFFRRD